MEKQAKMMRKKMIATRRHLLIVRVEREQRSQLFLHEECLVQEKFS